MQAEERGEVSCTAQKSKERLLSEGVLSLYLCLIPNQNGSHDLHREGRAYYLLKSLSRLSLALT